MKAARMTHPTVSIVESAWIEEIFPNIVSLCVPSRRSSSFLFSLRVMIIPITSRSVVTARAAPGFNVKKKFNGKKVYIGMSPALVIGHPTTLVASLILIPLALVLAVILPGNQFLPLASLAGMFYVFVMVLPYTKGNVVKTLIIGFVAVGIGLWFVTDMAPAFTQAAQAVYAQTSDPAAKIPEGFQAGALDFASSLFGWVIYKCVNNLRWIGAGVLTLITIAMMFWNRKRIVADEQKAAKEVEA